MRTKTLPFCLADNRVFIWAHLPSGNLGNCVEANETVKALFSFERKFIWSNLLFQPLARPKWSTVQRGPKNKKYSDSWRYRHQPKHECTNTYSGTLHVRFVDCTVNSKRKYTVCFQASTQNVGSLGAEPGCGWWPIGGPHQLETGSWKNSKRFQRSEQKCLQNLEWTVAGDFLTNQVLFGAKLQRDTLCAMLKAASFKLFKRWSYLRWS